MLRLGSTRRSLTRPVVALALTAGLVSPVVAAPAQAAIPTTPPVITTIMNLYKLYQQFTSGGGLTLQQAVNQIEAAIQQTQTAIIDQIEQVATASIQGCATAAVVDFANINLLTTSQLQNFAQNATLCVAQAQSLISVASDKASIDNLGFAMNLAGPVALIASADAGFSVTGLQSVLISGENSIITDLTPTCVKVFENPDFNNFFTWQCTAYDGTVGQETKPLSAAQASATADTSRPVALSALPTL
jgi:hypothetical protein